jgi:hypothetical protein
MHGKGRLLIVTGLIYEGTFNKSSCDSIGKLLYASGDIYFG